MESFFRRLETYTTVPTTDAMKDIIVKIMAEVLGIFAIVTKEMKLGRGSELTPDDTLPTTDRDSEKYLRKLLGRTDIEDALRRLDTLTQEEARMAAAEVLKVAHRIEDGVRAVGADVRGVDVRVQEVDNRVKGVDDKVKGVDNKIGVAIMGTLSALGTHKCHPKPIHSRRQGDKGSHATHGKPYGES